MAVAAAPRQNTAHARHTTRCGNGASDENDRGWRHQACRGEVAGDCRRTLSDDRRWKSGDVDLNGDSLRAASSRRRHHEPYWLIRAAHPRQCRCAPSELRQRAARARAQLELPARAEQQARITRTLRRSRIRRRRDCGCRALRKEDRLLNMPWIGC